MKLPLAHQTSSPVTPTYLPVTLASTASTASIRVSSTASSDTTDVVPTPSAKPVRPAPTALAAEPTVASVTASRPPHSKGVDLSSMGPGAVGVVLGARHPGLDISAAVGAAEPKRGLGFGADDPLSAAIDPRLTQVDVKALEAWLAAHPEISVDAELPSSIRNGIGVVMSCSPGLLDELAAALRNANQTITIVYEGEGGGYNFSTNKLRVGERQTPLMHPVISLYHEFVHAYQDLVAGRPVGVTFAERLEDGVQVEVGDRNVELQAMGLPYLDATGAIHAGDELPYSENVFRHWLGVERRPSYGFRPIGAPVRFGETLND